MERLSEFEIDWLFRNRKTKNTDLIERKQVGRIVYEFCRGPSKYGRKWRVCVKGILPLDFLDNYQRTFSTRKEAQTYIKELKVKQLLES